MSFQNTQGSNVSGDSYDGQNAHAKQSMSNIGKLYMYLSGFLALVNTIVEIFPVGDSEEANQKAIYDLVELQFENAIRTIEFNGKLSEYLITSDTDVDDDFGRRHEKWFKEALRIGLLYHLCDTVLLAVPPEGWKMIRHEFMINLNSFKSDIKEELFDVLDLFFEIELDKYYKNNKFVEDCMTIEPKVHSASLFPHDFPLERYRDYDPSGQPEDNQADGINTENPKLEVAKIISNIKLLDANGQFYPAKIDISYNFVCQFCDAQVPIDQLQQEFKHSDTCRRESETCVDQGINYVDFSRNIIEQIAELPSI